MKKQLLLLALTIGASSSLVIAQDAPPAGGRPPGGEGGQGGGPGRPKNPIIEALDTNHDGVIDAAELAKAGESLKALDKNGDGKLSEDEFRPKRPEGQGSGRPPGGGGQGDAQRPPLEK
jgi:hypothetical protein